MSSYPEFRASTGQAVTWPAYNNHTEMYIHFTASTTADAAKSRLLPQPTSFWNELMPALWEVKGSEQVGRTTMGTPRAEPTAEPESEGEAEPEGEGEPESEGEAEPETEGEPEGEGEPTAVPNDGPKDNKGHKSSRSSDGPSLISRDDVSKLNSGIFKFKPGINKPFHPDSHKIICYEICLFLTLPFQAETALFILIMVLISLVLGFGVLLMEYFGLKEQLTKEMKANAKAAQEKNGGVKSDIIEIGYVSTADTPTGASKYEFSNTAMEDNDSQGGNHSEANAYGKEIEIE